MTMDWVLIIGAIAGGFVTVLSALFSGIIALKQVPKLGVELEKQTSVLEKTHEAVNSASERADAAKAAAIAATEAALASRDVIIEQLRQQQQAAQEAALEKAEAREAKPGDVTSLRPAELQITDVRVVNEPDSPVPVKPIEEEDKK